MLGTIPARAGETKCTNQARTQDWDHPRSRGGNTFQMRRWPWMPGPSPLARGKLLRNSRAMLASGTIPARAGETPSMRQGNMSARDHPRSRGGNAVKELTEKDGWGPSPLARGKPRYGDAG